LSSNLHFDRNGASCNATLKLVGGGRKKKEKKEREEGMNDDSNLLGGYVYGEKGDLCGAEAGGRLRCPAAGFRARERN
jgi:hypothetical protein